MFCNIIFFLDLACGYNKSTLTGQKLSFFNVSTSLLSCHGPKGCGNVSTLGWLLFLLAALLPGSRSKENLEFRRLKSTQQQQTYNWLLQQNMGFCGEVWCHTMFRWKEGWLATLWDLVQLRPGGHQLHWSDLQVCQLPQTLLSVSDHGLNHVQFLSDHWDLWLEGQEEVSECFRQVSLLSWWWSTCSCGVRIASNSRLRMPWLVFRAEGALSWWVLRLCRASWAPSLVWNLSTIWLARR